MILYVNDKNEIKDVDVTTDTSLTPLTVTDDDNPFAGWSIAKICCYKVEVTDGFVTMMTPYVDSKLLEHIDELGKADESAAGDILNTQIALTETFEKASFSEKEITELQLAVVEMYEMIVGGTE